MEGSQNMSQMSMVLRHFWTEYSVYFIPSKMFANEMIVTIFNTFICTLKIH